MRGAHHRLGVTLPPKFDRRFHRDGGGTVSVYDTGHYRIFGVTQAQSGDLTQKWPSLMRARWQFLNCLMS